jgi:hypothetical protein
MMFHHPGVIVAEPVGGLQLRQRVLIQPEFVTGLPRAWQLQLIEDAEFHDVSPGIGCCFAQCRPGKSRVQHFANSARRKPACAERMNG